MHIYAGAAAIPNVVGRADYISSPARQERLIAVAGIQDKTYWKQLAHDAQEAWRRSGGEREKKKACEAREVHVQLPGKILEMSPDEQQQVVDRLEAFFRAKYGLDTLIGMHESKTDRNVHAHILFSDRPRLAEPEIRVADRNAFIGADGIRCRTKKEILDADGELLPGCKIIKKGDVLYERHFGDRDPIFAEKGWLNDLKHDLANWINTELQPDELREVYDPAGPYLPQVKVGKGRPVSFENRLKEYNRQVKAFNKLVCEGEISLEDAQRYKTTIMLSPDRSAALAAVLAAQTSQRAWEVLGDTVLARFSPGQLDRIETSLGSQRTHETADEPLKRQLREAYRMAATERQAARNATNSVDRAIHQSQAKQYSARIDRLRREMGLYTNEDFLRRQRRLEAELRRQRSWVLRCRTKVAYLSRRIDGISGHIRALERELANLPFFLLTPEQQQQRQALYRAISEAKADRDAALLQEALARKQYKQAKRDARQQRIELQHEKKEQRQQEKKRRPTDRDAR